MLNCRNVCNILATSLRNEILSIVSYLSPLLITSLLRLIASFSIQKDVDLPCHCDRDQLFLFYLGIILTFEDHNNDKFL